MGNGDQAAHENDGRVSGDGVEGLRHETEKLLREEREQATTPEDHQVVS